MGGISSPGGWRTSSIGHVPKKSYQGGRGGVGVQGARFPEKKRGGGGGGGKGRGSKGGGGAFTGGSGMNSKVAPNPYLDKIFNRFQGLFDQSQDLYGKALDPTPALQNYQDLRAQGMKEATAAAGQRGFAPGTGMSLAQTQDILSRSQQGEHELAANWQNRGLEFQKGLLGTMGGILGGAGGVGGQIGQEQLGYGRLGLDSQKHLTDAWYKSQMLPIEMEKAKNANLSTQIQAIGALKGLF